MKDRLIPCKFYICAHECKKGRDAEIMGYCQHCALYKKDKHRAPIKTNNKQKQIEKDRMRDDTY